MGFPAVSFFAHVKSPPRTPGHPRQKPHEIGFCGTTEPEETPTHEEELAKVRANQSTNRQRHANGLGESTIRKRKS